MTSMRRSPRVFLETRRAERRPARTGFMAPGLPLQVASSLAAAQLLHLAPDAYGDPVFTPGDDDWDELVGVLRSVVDRHPLTTSASSRCTTSQGGSGFALMAPFDRTDRSLPIGQRRSLDAVYRPREVFVVHHGWVTKQRSITSSSFEWWADSDRKVETYLLGLARQNGFDSALRSRKILDRYGTAVLPRERPIVH